MGGETCKPLAALDAAAILTDADWSATRRFSTFEAKLDLLLSTERAPAVLARRWQWHRQQVVRFLARLGGGAGAVPAGISLEGPSAPAPTPGSAPAPLRLVPQAVLPGVELPEAPEKVNAQQDRCGAIVHRIEEQGGSECTPALVGAWIARYGLEMVHDVVDELELAGHLEKGGRYVAAVLKRKHAEGGVETVKQDKHLAVLDGQWAPTGRERYSSYSGSWVPRNEWLPVAELVKRRGPYQGGQKVEQQTRLLA